MVVLYIIIAVISSSYSVALSIRPKHSHEVSQFCLIASPVQI